jgi:DNA-binding transcriptional MerR regulator
MTIGEFSQATRLTAKALRFYHREGILVPAEIDQDNGYRLYAPRQIADAEVVRQLRALEIPVDTIRDILTASSVAARSELVASHLTRLVSALRSVLGDPPVRAQVLHRSVPPVPALVIRATIDLADLSEWYSLARAELAAISRSPGIRASGPRGGIWATELFLDEHGDAALFQPITSLDHAPSALGRVRPELLPPVELAIAVHRGPDDSIAQTYGALGTYVAQHELGIAGPIRESYLREPTVDFPEVVTEIGWPIFRVSR